MTPTETAALVALVKSLRPAQYWDEHSEEAWHMVLEDVSAADAFEALKALGKTHKFIGTDDICAKVAELRKDRMGRVIPTAAVTADPDDPVAYVRDIHRVLDEIGAGGMSPGLRELGPAEPVPASRSAEWVAARAALSGQSEEFLRRRAAANEVVCRGCGAVVGVSCSFEGVTLVKSPAHPERLEDVGLLAPHRSVTAEEFAALVASEGRPGGV